MSASARRTIWFVLAPLLFVAVLGLLALWVVWSLLTPNQPPNQDDAPTQLAGVPLQLERGASSLAWSADGSYVAAGTSGPPARYSSWTWPRRPS
jgi:hypothetical protein